MQFNNYKPIYLQLADRLSDDIVDGKYNDDDRVPSVREFGMCFEVNTNTAVKAYEPFRAVLRAFLYCVINYIYKKALKTRKGD